MRGHSIGSAPPQCKAPHRDGSDESQCTMHINTTKQKRIQKGTRRSIHAAAQTLQHAVAWSSIHEVDWHHHAVTRLGESCDAHGMSTCDLSILCWLSGCDASVSNPYAACSWCWCCSFSVSLRCPALVCVIALALMPSDIPFPPAGSAL